MSEYQEIYSRDFDILDNSFGRIQWKGTDVCMDLYCICGDHAHFDGEFLYGYQCQECGRYYALGRNVCLIELTSPEEIDYIGDFKTGLIE